MEIEMSLKLGAMEVVNQDIVNTLRDNKFHDVKITTTHKYCEMDPRNQTEFKSLKNVKIVYKKVDGGVLIILGSLQCDFRPPFGGAFFIVRIIDEPGSDFKNIKGVDARIRFVNDASPITDIQSTKNYLDRIFHDRDFEYNIGQFDEFMKIFEFYKALSDELNNNVTYSINDISKPYYYLPADVKDVNLEFKEEVKDQNGILKGYRFSETSYVSLKNEIKQKVRKLVDIHINGGNEEAAKIRRMGAENIYLSNSLKISEKEVRNLKSFDLINLRQQSGQITLSGELEKDLDLGETYAYLNLYDMGQKIKIESIDNSLRLINQGATGAATQLLEYLIGDKKMPNRDKREVTPAKERYMEGLNQSQREAFMMAVDGSPVSLIKGPPGTGKTHVINAIVQYITKELNERVVISSQTHIAIDNVLDKLVENYDLIIPNRITNRRNRYGTDFIDETLYNTWGHKFLNHNKRASNQTLAAAIAEDMKKFDGEKHFTYSEETGTTEYSVIGATTTTSAIAGRKGLETLKGYDWLIIDEVSKCPITEVLRYLPYVSKIIMVGDDFQLSPLLEFNKEDVKHLPSYNEDMFEKLQSIYEQSVFAKVMEKAKAANRLVLLNENYRSLEHVLKVYNFFYDNKLIGKRESIKPDKVHFKNDAYENHDAFFVDVKGGQETTDGTSRFNIEEINATVLILKELMREIKNPENVSVSAIFPYAAQISHFQRNNTKLCNEAKTKFKSFEIDTVDAFQGKETDIVLVNTVVADSSKRNFLNDFRRINVAMSRARDKLIVFGNPIVLSRIRMKTTNGEERNYFKNIIEYIKAEGQYIEYKDGGINYANTRTNSFKLA